MPFDFSQNWQIYAIMGQFGVFDEISGGELDINVTDYVPGGARSALKIQGTNSSNDLVLSRAWAPDRDNAVVDWCKLSKDGLTPPIAVTIVTQNHQGIITDSRVYKTCVVKNLKYPDGRAGDNSMTMIQVTLAVQE